MTVRIFKIPSYCHHKAKGLAFVKLGCDFVYLGRYGSPESKVAYERVVAEWLARGRLPEGCSKDADPEGPSINEVLLAFMRHAQTYYVQPNGSPSLEFDKIAQSIRSLKELYGTTRAREFGPIALKVL